MSPCCRPKYFSPAVSLGYKYADTTYSRLIAARTIQQIALLIIKYLYNINTVHESLKGSGGFINSRFHIAIGDLSLNSIGIRLVIKLRKYFTPTPSILSYITSLLYCPPKIALTTPGKLNAGKRKPCFK